MDPLVWDANNVPHSPVFNDKYFCSQNGHEDILHVFCHGNNLLERFSSLNADQPGVFTIIETGFGTGLGFCTVWQLWDELAPKSWQLHFISVELYPLAVDDMARALLSWSQLVRPRTNLLKQYQPVPGGVMDVAFDDKRVRLSVVFEDAASALRKIYQTGLAPNGADAWFLHGFAPSKNPAMWSQDVFLAMAPLSRQGTTVATFTCAGHVRRGLVSQGFDVKRVKGYGQKTTILAGSC